MLIIENVSGVEVDINDLGLSLSPNQSIDLATEGNAADVTVSGSVDGDLNQLISSGNIVVKDPIDITTNLSTTDAINLVKSHNEPHFRMPIGARIADAIDVDLSSPGTFLKFDGATFTRQTPEDLASEIESSIDISNIVGGHNAWEIIDADGTTNIKVDNNIAIDFPIITYQVNGTQVARMVEDSTQFLTPIDVPQGTALEPTIYFRDSDTGFFSKGPNQLSVATRGEETTIFNNDGIILTSNNAFGSGSPRIGFNNTDTGGPNGSTNSATIFFQDGNLNLAATGGVTRYDISLKDNGDIEFPEYPNTRDDGSTSKALYVDDNGVLQYGDIVAGAEGSPLAVVQVRRTSAYTLTTTYADITWNATPDEETDATTLEHNSATADRIEVKADGIYLITYNVSINSPTPNSTAQAFGRIRVNDSTVLNGSNARTAAVSDSSLSGAGGPAVDDHLSNQFFVTLSAGDFVTLQLRRTGDTLTAYTNATMAIVKLDGVKGDKGDPGGGTPSAPLNSIQFNTDGDFDGSADFLRDELNRRIHIRGTPATNQLTVGGDTQVVAADTNAALYVEVVTTGVAEGMRTYFNRSTPGINGWITYDYDGNTPSIKLVDEDDDSPYIDFNVIGNGTEANPQFSNEFGGAGAVASATNGFSWKENGTEVTTLQAGVMNVIGTAADYRINNESLIPRRAYYHNGGTTQTFITTFTTINFNTQVRQDVGYIESNGVVTFTRAGTYEIEYDVSITVLAGSSRCGSETRATLNNVEVTGSKAWGYHRQSAPGADTAHAKFLLVVTTGQQLRIQSRRYNGGGTLTTLANSCRLNIQSVI